MARGRSGLVPLSGKLKNFIIYREIHQRLFRCVRLPLNENYFRGLTCRLNVFPRFYVSQDGSRHPLAVLGAVNEFAETNNLQVCYRYARRVLMSVRTFHLCHVMLSPKSQVIVTPFDKWHSWMIRKPETLCT